MRLAAELGDVDAFLAAVKWRSRVMVNGCWEWLGPLDTDGYPRATVNAGKAMRALHRLVLEAKMGAPLGSQHAHHACANRRCVNPAHLQPVTHAQNVAEMLARQSLLARVAELESALRKLDPTHELLTHIPVR